MTGSETRKATRRQVLQGAAALTTASAVPSGWAIAQAKPLKVGLMLPYSGTFAKLGENITFAIELLLAEKGGKLGGREIQFIKLDDESKPDTAPQNADRLVKRDQVDVLIGTVHSGVQMGIHKVVQESGHAHDRAECRQRGRHAQPVRQECLPLVFHQLAAGLRHGRGRGQEGDTRRACG